MRQYTGCLSPKASYVGPRRWPIGLGRPKVYIVRIMRDASRCKWLASGKTTHLCYHDIEITPQWLVAIAALVRSHARSNASAIRPRLDIANSGKSVSTLRARCEERGLGRRPIWFPYWVARSARGLRQITVALPGPPKVSRNVRFVNGVPEKA